MRLSRLGTVFALTYRLPSVTCMAMALSSRTDPKGHLALLQIPIVLQLTALSERGGAPSCGTQRGSKPIRFVARRSHWH